MACVSRWVIVEMTFLMISGGRWLLVMLVMLGIMRPVYRILLPPILAHLGEHRIGDSRREGNLVGCIIECVQILMRVERYDVGGGVLEFDVCTHGFSTPSTPRAIRSRVRFCSHINASSRCVSATAFSRHANFPRVNSGPPSAALATG